MSLQLITQANDHSYVGFIIVGLLLLGVLFLILLFVRKVVTTVLDGIELFYSFFAKRPIFVHFYVYKRKLKPNQLAILKQEFSFYNRLDSKRKRYFEHRIAVFLKKKSLEGKDGFVITEEVKILVAATAIMLTFGFRNYLIQFVKRIIVYPTAYYSAFSKTHNKGEFNPRLKTLVLSWDNFIEGYRIEDDKLNLGIHEFAHAIHFNSLKSEDINSIIFVDTFNELRTRLNKDAILKKRLEKSNLLRDYAFTNDSELLAVLLETFIESPKEFRKQFPSIYDLVKQMLNFKFT